MKKVLLIISILAIISSSFSQKQNLTKEEKTHLMDIVVPILQKCIQNFDGSYKPGTTITSVFKQTENKYTVEGTCTYWGEQCGLVSNTSYKVSVYQEGSQTYGETCILTPYCLFGIVTSQEWDCNCRKWQYENDTSLKGAIDLLIFLQKISQ